MWSTLRAPLSTSRHRLAMQSVSSSLLMDVQRPDQDCEINAHASLFWM
jgi:hypothetical protein